MNATNDYRVKPPAKHADLISCLIKDAGFPTIRDVLLFSALLGYSESRSGDVGKGGEPIRLHVLLTSAWAAHVLPMLAAVTNEPSDHSVVLPERTADQLTVFESYAVGGLDYVQELIDGNGFKSLSEIVSDLVSRALVEPTTNVEFTDEELEGLILG